MPTHSPSLPKERFPVGCAFLGLSIAVILWGFDLQWVFWGFVSLVAICTLRVSLGALRARRHGWTIACSGPEIIRYGKRVDERWEWIDFWVPGSGPDIFVGTEGDWSRLPAWARFERDVILERLKREFPRLNLIAQDYQ